jgi:hypothetical protein
MSLNKRVLRIAAVMVLGIVFTASAIDYGLPVYEDNFDANVRVEGIYNSFDRDIKVGSVKKNLDANVYMARLDIPGDIAATYLDAGYFDDSLADGSTPAIVGAGIRISSYKSDIMRVSLLFNGHYVPSYDTKENGFKGSRDFYELGAGLLFSANLATDDSQWQFLPYAGLVYSIIQGSYDVTISPPAADGTSKLDHDIKEEDGAVGILGAGIIYSERYSLRVEADLFSDSSLSAAFGVAF